MSDREFDLVVFGATGYTGELVADYLVTVSAERALPLCEGLGSAAAPRAARAGDGAIAGSAAVQRKKRGLADLRFGSRTPRSRRATSRGRRRRRRSLPTRRRHVASGPKGRARPILWSRREAWALHVRSSRRAVRRRVVLVRRRVGPRRRDGVLAHRRTVLGLSLAVYRWRRVGRGQRRWNASSTGGLRLRPLLWRARRRVPRDRQRRAPAARARSSGRCNPVRDAMMRAKLPTGSAPSRRGGSPPSSSSTRPTPALAAARRHARASCTTARRLRTMAALLAPRARRGRHYADLTGEAPSSASIAAHDAAGAALRRASCVARCSVPPDIAYSRSRAGRLPGDHRARSSRPRARRRVGRQRLADVRSRTTRSRAGRGAREGDADPFQIALRAAAVPGAPSATDPAAARLAFAALAAAACWSAARAGGTRGRQVAGTATCASGARAFVMAALNTRASCAGRRQSQARATRRGAPPRTPTARASCTTSTSRPAVLPALSGAQWRCAPVFTATFTVAVKGVAPRRPRSAARCCSRRPRARCSRASCCPRRARARRPPRATSGRALSSRSASPCGGGRRAVFGRVACDDADPFVQGHRAHPRGGGPAARRGPQGGPRRRRA